MFFLFAYAASTNQMVTTSSRQRLASVATGFADHFESSSAGEASASFKSSSPLFAACCTGSIVLLSVILWRLSSNNKLSSESPIICWTYLANLGRKSTLSLNGPTPPIVHIPRDVQLSSRGHDAYHRALNEHGDVVIIPRHGRLEYVVDHRHVRNVLTDANHYSFEKAVTNMLHMEFMLWFKQGTFVQELDKLVQDGVTPRLRAVVEKVSPVFSQEAAEAFAGERKHDETVEIDDAYRFVHHAIARAMVILILGDEYLNEAMTDRFMDVVGAIANLSGIYENTKGWRAFSWLWSMKTTLGAIFFTIVPRFFFGIVPQIYGKVHHHMDRGIDVENNEYAPFLDLLAAKHRNRATGKLSFLNFIWCAVICLGIIFASIHQTAVVAVWCMMNLASRKEYQQDIRNEIDGCLERDADGTRLLTVESLRKAVKLDSFIRETMRTKGDTFAPVRFTIEDVRVGKYIIPKGSLVAPYVKRAHEHPDNYGEMGASFDGTRWIPDRENKPTVQGGHDFISFGLGRWACPGRHLAVAELKMVMATMFDTYDISLKEEKFEAADPMNATSVAPNGTLVLRRRNAAMY